MDMNLSKHWEIVKDRETWCATVMGLQIVGHDLAYEQQQLVRLMNLEPVIQREVRKIKANIVY